MRRESVIVLDVIEPGIEPDYCCHGRTPCIGCSEWCWLGDKSLPVISSGRALPMCLPCAIKTIPPDSRPSEHIMDHRRAEGPHDDSV